MTDMASVIVPKSDQLNADDLLVGPRTIKIREVRVAPSGEQRVSIFFDGDNGKPWKPCKSMARVLVAAWGPDSKAYAGRSLTLYRDSSVKWAGMEVGGIRVSHMSDMSSKLAMALTATKGVKAVHTVQVLKTEQLKEPPVQPIDKLTHTVELIEKRISEAKSQNELDEIAADPTVRNQRDWFLAKKPELSARVEKAFADKTQSFGPPTDEDDFPGNMPSAEQAA